MKDTFIIITFILGSVNAVFGPKWWDAFLAATLIAMALAGAIWF